MAEDRIMQGQRVDGDESSFENSLRPKTLDEYVGQNKVKANLAVFIEAALQRSEPLDHVLVYGPPGLGKTTLAHVIAREMDAPIRITSGPSIASAVPQSTTAAAAAHSPATRRIPIVDLSFPALPAYPPSSSSCRSIWSR